jgi:hypothetical protein
LHKELKRIYSILLPIKEIEEKYIKTITISTVKLECEGDSITKE